MKLDAYSNRDIQQTIGIIEQAINEKKRHDLKSLVSILKTKMQKPVSSAIVKQTSEKKMCPSCGAALSCDKIIDGLKISGCKKCRFSEVV